MTAKLPESQHYALRWVAMFDHMGGSCPLSYSEYRSYEALRRRKLVRRINKSRKWERSFYEITDAGRAAIPDTSSLLRTFEVAKDWICSQCGEWHSDHEVVIRKGGYFYRPGWCGYTSSIHEAGRYKRGEAEDHAANAEGITIHKPSEFLPVQAT